MQFTHPEADIFVPDGQPLDAALARVTHLAIGAHPDDLEVMAHGAIAHCIDHPDTAAFGGVVVTHGAGSARTGPYAEKSDREMQEIRRAEQRRAAQVGRYAVQFQLSHASAAVRSRAAGTGVEADLYAILSAARPTEVYVHNPFDKHDTHVGVFLRCLGALRRLPPDQRPVRILGVEVWRSLEWLIPDDKVALDDSAHPELRRELMALFDSQIAGGKGYDQAVEGRRAANATFDDPHMIDATDRLTWAVDLMPFLENPTLTVNDFVTEKIDRLRADVLARIHRLR